MACPQEPGAHTGARPCRPAASGGGVGQRLGRTGALRGSRAAAAGASVAGSSGRWPGRGLRRGGGGVRASRQAAAPRGVASSSFVLPGARRRT